MGIILINVSYLYFVFVFVGILGQKKGMLGFIFFVNLFFVVLNFTGRLYTGLTPRFDLGFWPSPTTFFHVYLVLWFLQCIYGFYWLLRGLKLHSGIDKIRMKYFTIAAVIGFAGGATNWPMWYNIYFPPYLNIMISLYIGIVAYAIIRYRLMDIRIVFKRTMAYSLSAGFLTGLFVILVLTLTSLFSSFVEVSSLTVSMFAAIVIALLFDPLRNRIQKIVDNIFYKKSYDYYAIIRRTSHDLASLFDFEKIYNFVGDMFYLTLGLKSIYLFSSIQGGGYELVFHKSRKDEHRKKNSNGNSSDKKMKINKRSDLVKYFRSSDDIIIKDDLLRSKDSEEMDLMPNIKEELEYFNAEAVVPVFIDRKLTSLLILGEKMSGDIFTLEDIDLLNTISAQTAIAIKNASLYKEKIHSERLASIGMMSATFAHEIRNPLTSLKTFAQLIPEKYNDAEFRDKFSKIVLGEIERVNRLIEDLLDFSNDKKTPGVNIFDIKGLLDELVDYVRDRLEIDSRNIIVEKNYDENVVQLSGNEDRLKHAFINIMNNGCQAMNGDGVLKIRISKSDRYVDVDIADTGEGISPDSMDRIFDPFVTTKEMGIGLGLAISKKIVEDHGGRIKVKSILKKGTTFTISLPLDKNNNGEMKNVKQRTNMEIG